MNKTKKKPRKKPANRKPSTRTNYRKRAYDDAQRFAAMTLAREVSVSEASRRMNIPEPTIRAWLNGFRSESSLRLYELSAGQLANACHAAAWDLMASVHSKIDEAPLNHVMQAFKVAMESERVLRGQPTQYTESKTLAAKIDLNRMAPHERETLARLLDRAQTTVDGRPEPEQSGSAPPAIAESGVPTEPIRVRAPIVVGSQPGT